MVLWLDLDWWKVSALFSFTQSRHSSAMWDNKIMCYQRLAVVLLLCNAEIDHFGLIGVTSYIIVELLWWAVLCIFVFRGPKKYLHTATTVLCCSVCGSINLSDIDSVPPTRPSHDQLLWLLSRVRILKNLIKVRKVDTVFYLSLASCKKITQVLQNTKHIGEVSRAPP